MAQVLNVRLARNDMSPWGFRLQGGKDFGTPLVIQKVNGGSPADRAGLQAGDAVIRVNGNDVFNLRHKDAQDTIVRAGQSFELTIQRGASTWKPAVTTVGSLPTPKPTINNIVPVTKTSLAANKQQSTPIGTGHNLAAKPFLNGTSDVRLVNKQFNSPIGLYSEASIAETLSAQSEVLSTGALGVNFKKNEKTYNAANSEVLKMVQEADKEPRDFEPEIAEGPAVGGGVAPSNPAPVPVGPSGLRHVTAPVSAPPSQAPPAGGTKQLPPGQNICADCERLIVGVFVRIKDKNLHVECFKCATCGTSLKNVGYYNINNKLYCDIHAKLAAKTNPPAPNLVPITIPPGGKIPAGTISAALAAHPLPSPLSPSANAAPAPFLIENEYRDDVIDNRMPVPPSLSSNSLNAFATSLAKAAEKRQNGSHDNGTVAQAKPFKGKPSTLLNGYLDKNDHQNGHSNGIQNNISNGHENGHSVQNNKLNDIQNHNGNGYSAINRNGYQLNGYRNGIKQNGSFQNGGSQNDHVANNNGYHRSMGYRNGQQNGFQNRNNNLKNAFLNGNNETKPKTYVSEKIITVNNGNSNNNEKTVELKSPAFFNFKPSTNNVLSGPRPFNAGAPLSPVAPVSAPITNNYAATLPRSAPQQSAQPEHPSVVPESEIQLPESVPHEPEPPQVSAEDRKRVKIWPPPKTEDECPTATPLYVPPNPSNPVRIKPVLPKCGSAQNVESTNLESQRSECENVEEQAELPTATSFGESITTRSEQKAWKPVPGPTGTTHTNEVSLSVDDYGAAFDVSNRLPRDENDNLICSAEVTDITGRKSVAECAEAIAETVDTLMLIEKLTEEYRPPTPPPMPPITFPTNVPPIPEFKRPAPFTSDVASTETKEYKAVKGVCTKSKQSAVSEIQELTKQVVTDVQRQLELVVKQVDSVQKQLETVESSVIEKNAPKATDVSSECPIKAETCPKTCIEQSHIPPRDADRLLECLSEATTCPKNISEPSLPQTSVPISESQSGSSNSFLNTVPKQWQSQLLSALTVASDRPYSPLPFILETEATETSCASESVESSSLQYKQIAESNGNGFVPISTADASTDFPHSKSKTSTTQFTSALTIAPSQPFTPQPTTTLDPVPLPEETVPYIPEELPKQESKISATKQEFKRQETGVKSPFLEALITAPPLGSEISEGQFQQGNLLQDLPTPDYNATMLSALTTAPERPFTPVWSEQPKDSGSYPEQRGVKSAFKPVPPKSIAPSIQPPSIQPTTSKTFPPVSDNLKNVYKPFVEIAPSKIVRQQEAQSCEPIEQNFVGKPPTPKPQIAKPQTPKPYYSSAGLHKPAAIPHYQQSLNQLTQLPSQTPVKTPDPDTVIEHESIESHEFQQQKVNESQQRVAEKFSSTLQKNQQSIVSKTVEATSVSVHQQSQISVQKSESQQSISSAKKSTITTVSENVFPQSIPIVQVPENPVPWRRQSSKPTKKSQIPRADAQQASSSSIQVQAAPSQVSARPVITVQPEQQTPPSQALFKPVSENQSSLTSSTRPAALTPSMINNPAPIIPHYQVNLIAREHLAAETNMYDPTHPEISRSPSPHPNRSRSPFVRAKSPVPRSRSPSEGPHLRAQAPRIKDGKQNVSNIPKYQSQGLVQNRKDSLLAQSATTTKHVQFGGPSLRPSQGHSAEKSTFSSEEERVQGDCLAQIQRKKITTEEIENSRKIVEIERATGSLSTVLKAQDGAIASQQQKIKQVHSAKGLKIYETSSGKPVPIDSRAVQTSSQSLFRTPPQMRTLPESRADAPVSGGLIKPRPITGVPTPFVSLDSSQTRPLSAFSMIPNKASGFAPVNRQQPDRAIPPPPAYTNQQTNALASNASATAPPPPVVSSNVSSVPPAGVPSAPFSGGAPGAPFGGGAPRPGPTPGAIGGGVKGKQTGAVGIAPRRGKGILNKAIGPGARVPLCAHCNGHIRGPFITALGKIWCPEHFVCATPQCRRPLQDLGFVEEKGLLYCEHCFEQYLAPSCDQCKNKIKGDCLNAIGKHFHPECFCCAYCGKLFGNNPFFLEDALPYCEADWNELFTTKCFACGFPVEAGDRWVEALNNNYHSQCFNCTMCKKNLEGQSFYAKGGRPYCKNHAR